MGTDQPTFNTKYHLVKRYIVNAIESGIFQHGDKLPSIRQLVSDLKVSKNTVIRAYQELEAQQMVCAVPKSGYVVKRQATPQSEAVAPKHVDLFGICKEFLSYPNQKERLPTGSAHPNIDAPAITSLYAEIGRHSRMQPHISSHYQLPPGNELLIKQLAKITQDIGANTSPSDVYITYGAQQAISLALRATTQPGDIVAVESPCYFGNLLLLETLGLQAIEVPSCPRNGMDPDALKSAIEQWDVKAIVITPNFTNPTGALMPESHREQILAHSRDIPIIEDDVFGGLSYQPPLASLYSLDRHNRVIYVNSLSKNLDSRLRLGWVLPGKYRHQIEQGLLCDNMGGLNMMQSAVAAFLSSGKYKTHTSRMVRFYQANVRRFLMQFQLAMDAHNLRHQYRVHPVHGSYLLWFELPQHVDCYQVYKQCKDNHISILPGSVFSTQNQFSHCFRISVANFGSETDWTPALSLFAAILKRHINQISPRQPDKNVGVIPLNEAEREIN